MFVKTRGLLGLTMKVDNSTLVEVIGDRWLLEAV